MNSATDDSHSRFVNQMIILTRRRKVELNNLFTLFVVNIFGDFFQEMFELHDG